MDGAELYCLPQCAILRGIDGGWRWISVKNSYAILSDADLLTATRVYARRDYRTLINFSETVLRRRVEEMAGCGPEPSVTTKRGHKA